MEAMKGFFEDTVEMIENNKPKALYLTKLRYRTAWDMVRANFQKRDSGCVQEMQCMRCDLETDTPCCLNCMEPSDRAIWHDPSPLVLYK